MDSRGFINQFYKIREFNVSKSGVYGLYMVVFKVFNLCSYL